MPYRPERQNQYKNIGDDVHGTRNHKVKVRIYAMARGRRNPGFMDGAALEDD